MPLGSPWIALLLGAAAVSDASLYSSSVPSFLWSGRRVFGGGKANALEAATPASLAALVELLAGAPTAPSDLARHVDEAQLRNDGPPHLVLVLRHPARDSEQLRAAGLLHGMEAALEVAISAAGSGLIVPHTYPGSGAPLHKHLNRTVPTMEVSSSLVQDSAWLRALVGAQPADRAAPAVLSVDASDMAASGLARITADAHNATDGRYVAVFAPGAETDADADAARRRLGFPLPYDPFPMPGKPDGAGPWSCPLGEVYDATSGSCFRFVSITPTILVGLVIGAFLIVVTWIGLGCIMQVRTPQYLDQQVDEKAAKERARLLKGKEF